MSHTQVIAKFGGTRAMAAALALPPSTVQSWKASGLIPARHHARVLARARELNLALRPEDFFAAAAAGGSAA